MRIAASFGISFGNNDVELLGIRRLDLGCGGLDTNAAETTNANLQLGVDHLVDDDLSAPSILELPACEQGHELTLPNTFRPGLPPTIAQDGMRQLLSGPAELWNFLSPGNLHVLCQPSMYTNIRHPDPVVVFTARTVLLNLCLSSDPPDPFNLPSGGHRRLGWAVDTEGSRVGGYVPVWVHSLVDGFMTPQSASPSGFSVFVLDSSWLPSNLTEVDPGGVDNLTFKLVE